MADRRDDQTIFRIASTHKPYTPLGNAMLQDRRLSVEARGLLGSIMSRPINWQFNYAWLCKEHDVGREKSRRLVKELQRGGYCKHRRSRSSDGRLGDSEYMFTDDPQLFDEQYPEPKPGNPSVGENLGAGLSTVGLPGDGFSTPTKKRKNKGKEIGQTNSPAGQGEMTELQAFEAWNDLARRSKLLLATKLTEGRHRLLKKCLGQYGGEGWKRALANVERSKYLRGLTREKFRCDLGFLLKDENFARVHDGKYGDDLPVSLATPNAGLDKGFVYRSRDPQAFDAWVAHALRNGRKREADLWARTGAVGPVETLFPPGHAQMCEAS